MTALAMPADRRDHGAFRWGVSFATVAAAHAGAMLWLLYAPASMDSGYVAGAAVAMIDLPDTPAAKPNPVSELPPGPEEAPSEATPPPREETKPPQQVAEVALPEPDPPKPEPPTEERQATAPPPVVAAVAAPATAGVDTPQPPSAAVLRWQSGLSAEIKRLQQLPSSSGRTRGLKGKVRISLLIDRTGRVLQSHILESSGLRDLDQEALSKMDGARMPKPPPDVRDKDLAIEIGMNVSW
jgi:protein TonB